jgi:ribosomal protein S18 acetylase RimI-like enzyme
MQSATTFEVRRANASDLDLLVAFNQAMAQETEGKMLDPAILRAGINSVLSESRRGFYLVAEAAASVVGCLMITYEWSDWRNGDWWWIQSVYVDPNYRRAGVFRTMYAEIERVARAAPGVVGLRLYVERENIRAQETYAVLGMHAAHYSMWERGFFEGAVGDDQIVASQRAS